MGERENMAVEPEAEFDTNSSEETITTGGEYSDLQQRLREYKDLHGMTWADFEPYIPGYKGNTIGQFGNGTYTGGGLQKIAKLVSDFLDMESERATIAGVEKFYVEELSTSRVVREVIRSAHVGRKLAVIVGNPRLSKSETARRYAEEHSGVILIDSDVGYSPTVIYSQIADKIGTPVQRFDYMRESVVKALTNTSWFVIVDEAENIPYKSLEALRRLRDKSGIGMVLMGQKELAANLKGSLGQFKQLYGRVNIFCKLADKLQESDVEMVLLRLLNKKDVDHWKKRFYHECSWSIQRIFDLVENLFDVMAIRGKTEISDELIDAACSRLIS